MRHRACSPNGRITKKQKNFQEALALIAPELPFSVFEGKSQTVMAAADVVLLASGTATLEAMLLGKPMVVAYKLNRLTYWIAKRLLRINSFSLPNLLLQQKIVPEFIQDEATSVNLANAIMHYLDHPAEMLQIRQRFTEEHQRLRQQASQKAARAILEIAS